MLVGFNRRFDPNFRALHAGMRAGEIGTVEQVIITSRDPGLPPIAYFKVSGGQFRDMTIHDFDMARWLLGEEPVEVFAAGSCLVDPAVAKIGDIDSAMVVMQTASGRLCHINNSRRATYGYDQRIEVHGVEGPADRPAIGSPPPWSWPTRSVTPTSRSISSSSATPTPIAPSSRRSWMRCGPRSRCRSAPQDGRQALVLAEAALKSHRTGRPVKVPAPKGRA